MPAASKAGLEREVRLPAAVPSARSSPLADGNDGSSDLHASMYHRERSRLQVTPCLLFTHHNAMGLTISTCIATSAIVGL